MKWIAILVMIFLESLEACTAIKLIAKDGASVYGRTAEFGIDFQPSVVVIPRGMGFNGATPRGVGLKYVAKYKAVGMMAFDVPLILDGMNEKGLSIGAFYFPRYAQYAEVSADNQEKALSPIDFTNWIVTQFATVAEVRKALEEITIVATILKGWGTQSPPFHYIITDARGECIVVEPIQGVLKIYDNKLGVITNSPEFHWHMTNLVNYIHLTPFNLKPVNLAGVALAPFGQGSGMIGLPGDFTSPSRFVRAAIFSQNALPSANATKAVLEAFHILNQFDIPLGIVRAKEGVTTMTEWTLATVVRDPQALKYYFRTYEDQTIRYIDLNKVDSKMIQKASTISDQPIIDITDSLRTDISK